MWDALNEIDQDTKGWQNREVEGTGGHSSVLLDRRLNPWQESRDAGEDGIVLLITGLSQPFADDSNKNMSPFLIHCKWPTTVSLEVKHNAADEMIFWFGDAPCTVLSKHPLHTQSGFRPHLRSGSFSPYSCCFGRWELQSLAACLWRSLGLQWLPSLRACTTGLSVFMG